MPTTSHAHTFVHAQISTYTEHFGRLKHVFPNQTDIGQMFNFEASVAALFVDLTKYDNPEH